MFMLFTTPAAPQGGLKEGADAVIGAIREGAQKSGADFSYLVKTARQESALDPNAKASRSSATGLFQFVEQTWLKTLKEAGPRLGLGRLASAVIETKPGHFDVPDPAMRAEILKLRSDPKTASLMAGALTRSNAETLTDALGRKPDAADLYMAHVLGAGGAADLIRNSQINPQAPASDLFPDAAKSNPALFFDSVSGKAKSVGDVKAQLANAHAKASDGPAIAKSASAAPDEQPLAPLAYSHPDGPALFSLFRNVGNVAPLNPVVGALWTEPERFSADRPAYFPANGQGMPGFKSPTEAPISASAVATNSGKSAGSSRHSKPLDLTRFRKPEADDE
jgi:Transglycosylase SLT domain